MGRKSSIFLSLAVLYWEYLADQQDEEQEQKFEGGLQRG